MKKNLIAEFADWYILNHERLGSDYYTKFFREDKDVFISNLSEYAVEYALSFNSNPFIVEMEKKTEAISGLFENLKDKTSKFYEFSDSKSNHMPRAILGSNNYLRFLSENFIKNGSKAVHIIKKEELSEDISINKGLLINKETLRKNFFFRLITQDRYYDFLYFPISVLKKFFYLYDQTFFKKWLNLQIDNIEIHTDKKIIKFMDLQTLEIKSDGKILINTIANEQHVMFTPIAGSINKKELTANFLRNIVIDHIIPFEAIIFELKDQLPTLVRIHNKLVELSNGNALTNYQNLALAGNLLVGLEFLNKEDLAELKKELNLISSKTSLQLMDSKENLYKKKY